jgi:hypothetical protein
MLSKGGSCRKKQSYAEIAAKIRGFVVKITNHGRKLLDVKRVDSRKSIFNAAQRRGAAEVEGQVTRSTRGGYPALDIGKTMV